MTHGGFQELRKNWDAAARQPREHAQRIVTKLKPGETYYDSGKAAYEMLLTFLRSDDVGTILEFGCGLGRMTRFLAQRFNHVYAVDIAPGMVDAVRQLGLLNVTAICDNGLTLTVPNVDVVFSYAVLLHNRKQDVLRLWPEVLKKLKPNSRAYFQLPCYEVGREPRHWTDVGVWTKQELLQLAEAARCKPTRLYTNDGDFTFDALGHNHFKLHTFTKI